MTMTRFVLIAATVTAALVPATAGAAVTPLTRPGTAFYARSQPNPCHAHAVKHHPRLLALGCTCPRGNVVKHPSAVTYRFHIKAGRRFEFRVQWRFFKPKVTTSQAGPWSYVRVRGPRKCARTIQVRRVTVSPL
jgi:hypothetical protein